LLIMKKHNLAKGILRKNWNCLGLWEISIMESRDRKKVQFCRYRGQWSLKNSENSKKDQNNAFGDNLNWIHWIFMKIPLSQSKVMRVGKLGRSKNGFFFSEKKTSKIALKFWNFFHSLKKHFETSWVT